jgi:hypothetical protein
MSQLNVAKLSAGPTTLGRITLQAGTTMNVDGSLTLSSNDAFQLPRGTTAQRPTNPVVGEIRFNTTSNRVESWDGDSWVRYDDVTVAAAEDVVETYQRFQTPDVDPYWNNTALLIKDGQAIDYTGRHTVGTSGGATQNTVVVPWKRGVKSNCWRVGQNTSSYLQFNNNLSDFETQRDKWTLEYWVRPSSNSNYAHHFVPGGQNAQGTFKTYWQYNVSNPYMYTSAGNIVGTSYVDGPIEHGINTDLSQWYWVVFQKCGARMMNWVNGQLLEYKNSGASIPSGTPSFCRSGAWSNEAVVFNIDELRWTIGVARYPFDTAIPIQAKTWPTTAG